MRKLYKWFFRKKSIFSGDEKYCLHCNLEEVKMPFRSRELLFLFNAITSVKSKALTNINRLAEDNISEGILITFYQEIIDDSDKVLTRIIGEIRNRRVRKTYLETMIIEIENRCGKPWVAEFFKTMFYGRSKN